MDGVNNVNNVTTILLHISYYYCSYSFLFVRLFFCIYYLLFFILFLLLLLYSDTDTGFPLSGNYKVKSQNEMK